jgi:hypothetical protein
MSDAPQGPGWWQASDGRWYPPQPTPPPQQPVYQAPPQPQWGPPVGGPPPPAKSGGGKGCLIAALIAGAVVILGIVGVIVVVSITANKVKDKVDDFQTTDENGVITNSANSDHPPPDDVEITACQIDATGHMSFEAHVTNHSGGRSAYPVIIVAFDSKDGGNELGTAFAITAGVDPGEEVDVTGSSDSIPPSGGFDCRLSQVQRIADEGKD